MHHQLCHIGITNCASNVPRNNQEKLLTSTKEKQITCKPDIGYS